MSAATEPMTGSQRTIWTVIVGLIVILVGARAFIGQGMGRVYVDPKQVEYVNVSPESTDAKWVSASSDEGAEFLAGNVGAPTIGWTEFKQVEPKAYFEQEQAGGGSITMSWPRTIGLWVAAFFTLSIFSFLYRDNPFYKLAEAVVVGVSAGYWMVVGFWDVIIPNLVQRLFPAFSKAYFTPGLDMPQSWEAYLPNLIYLLPLILGIMLIMRLVPKCGWLSLWPLAFIVGTMAGFRLVGYIEGDFLGQIKATVVEQGAFYVEGSVANAGFWSVWSTFWASLSNILVVVGVLATLVYFFFSFEHKGVVGGTARVGIWYLMITFGAAFGFTVMGRIALLAARMEFLFDDWLWLIDPNEQRNVVVSAVSLLL